MISFSNTSESGQTDNSSYIGTLISMEKDKFVKVLSDNFQCLDPGTNAGMRI